MAARATLKAKIRKRLIEEAGGKCANPGCPNTTVEYHHIIAWAVYKTHDCEHMIVICPLCHSQVHGGKLRIDDDTLYAWKKIERRVDDKIRGHIYVEPARNATIVAGTIELRTTNQKLIAFNFSSSNSFSFELRGNEIMVPSLTLQSLDGRMLINMVDGHFKAPRADDIVLERRQGRVKLTIANNGTIVPEWMIEKMRVFESDFAADGRITMLDLCVVEPGKIRLQGVWLYDRFSAVIITGLSLSFIDFGMPRPISIIGNGEGGLIFGGDPNTAMLNIIRRVRPSLRTNP